MPKRLPSNFWARAMQRQIGALARTALKTSRKLAKAATPQIPKAAKRPIAVKGRKTSASGKARTPTKSKAPGMRIGRVVGPSGVQRYYVYRPAASASARPLSLLVMLHGCGQDASSFAASTRMNALADAAGCVVVYPEQDRLANMQGCWNWFDTRSGRAQREAATILAVIDQVCAAFPVAAGRVVVAGMSAGAGMAALLSLHYPERFAAVVMHSGVGPGLAQSPATALAAMRGRSLNSAGVLPPVETGRLLPALLVIQGPKDTVVAPVNGKLAAERWAATVQAKARAPRVVQRGARYATTLTDWTLGPLVVASLAEVTGLGHAWSGGAASQPYSDAAGPDASRMVLAFAHRAFSQRSGDVAI